MFGTLTKKQTEQFLQLSTDSVERLIHQGRLQRLAGMRAVRITLPSLSRYTGIPMAELVRIIDRQRHGPGGQDQGNWPYQL